MFKKVVLAALLAATSLAASAAEFYVVVPVKNKKAPAPTVSVSLATYGLPAGKVGAAYAGFDFNTALSVTGDPSFSSSNVTWSTASGSSLPPGLTLSAGGVLSGTPTEKNTAGAAFQVVASYKTKSGQQAYTLVVNGQYLDVSAISIGFSHACAVTLTGGAKCWGRNVYGQLGDGTTTSRLVPVDVMGLQSGVSKIVVASNPTAGHSCAVTNAGAVKCWGRNNVGQLGNGTTAASNVPVDVVGLPSGVTSISTAMAGGGGTVCVVVSGAAKCWGLNTTGQFGNDTLINSSVPVGVSGLGSGVASISLAPLYGCAVTTAGAAYCWGSNGGKLGNNSTVDSLVPVPVSGLSAGVASIATASAHSCVTTTNGGVKCWGGNMNGRLGNNSTTDSLVPVDVVSLSAGVASLSVGGHSCAVLVSGGLKCWGYNYYGQIGDGTTADSWVPVTAGGFPSGVTHVSVGSYTTCAIVAGAAKCWGGNTLNGLFGNGTTTDSLTPVDVLNP